MKFRLKILYVRQKYFLYIVYNTSIRISLLLNFQVNILHSVHLRYCTYSGKGDRERGRPLTFTD